MYIKPAPRTSRAFTLAEMLIALAVFSITGAAVMSFFLFGLRTFAAMYNYASLDAQNRNAMDVLSREIRGALQVVSYSTNPASLTIINADTNVVVYTFNAPPNSSLTRDAGGGTTGFPLEHQTLLQNCDLLQFQLYQRNPLTNAFDAFPASTDNWSNTVKLVELTWRTSVNLAPTIVTNSEDVQTARIVIRKARTQ
jgi:prepilin-type N-terminal cleavage/methylation domain-containing protein